MPNHKFKIGDKIRLNDYTRFEDYQSHNNQIAIIEEIFSGNGWSELDVRIMWEDGGESCVSFSNMILAKDYKPPKPKQYGVALFCKAMYI